MIKKKTTKTEKKIFNEFILQYVNPTSIYYFYDSKQNTTHKDKKP